LTVLSSAWCASQCYNTELPSGSSSNLERMSTFAFSVRFGISLSKLTMIIDKNCKCISHCRKLGVLYNFEINCTYCMFLILSYRLTTLFLVQVITKWMYYYLLLSSKKFNNNIWKMTVSLLTANNITSIVYEWLGYFISPYWWHTQLKHFWTKNHTATILNYLTLTRKIQREWTLNGLIFPTPTQPRISKVLFKQGWHVFTPKWNACWTIFTIVFFLRCHFANQISYIVILTFVVKNAILIQFII
jgi:hypothetical protein